jgi:hypothetical protein
MDDAVKQGPEVAELFRSPPEGFIARRNALVGRLREEGRSEDAAAVKRLRKPTVAAWALNRLSADAPEAIAELLASGEALSDAQRGVMGGGSAAALHEATARRRAIVAELAARANAILRASERVSDTHTEDIQGMLEAASVEAEAGERLRTGTIEKTVRPSSGFGLGLSLVDAGEDGSDEAPAPTPTPIRADRAGALDAEIASLTAAAKEQERALAKAERGQARASAAVEAAAERLEAAKAALRASDAELSAAQLEIKRTQRALERAERDRARLR